MGHGAHQVLFSPSTCLGRSRLVSCTRTGRVCAQRPARPVIEHELIESKHPHKLGAVLPFHRWGD